MGFARFDQAAAPVAAELADWRRRRLTRAGVPEGQADRLARDSRYDLHALLALIDRGCPPELAERIVAPDYDGGPPC